MSAERRPSSFPLPFRGRVECRRDDSAALGLTLTGVAGSLSDETLQVAFSARAPADFPESLEAPVVTQLDARRYRISSGCREWTIQGTAHLHREMSRAFYAALPPRAVSWHKRMFWRLLLELAANPMVRRLLLKP